MSGIYGRIAWSGIRAEHHPGFESMGQCRIFRPRQTGACCKVGRATVIQADLLCTYRERLQRPGTEHGYGEKVMTGRSFDLRAGLGNPEIWQRDVLRHRHATALMAANT